MPTTMKLVAYLAIAVILILIGVTLRAEAQPINACLPADTWLTTLADNYGERATVGATTMGGNAVTITVNPETGTWSMLIAVGPGMCMIAAGKNWWLVEDTPDAVIPNKAPEIYRRPNRDGFGYVVITRPA